MNLINMYYHCKIELIKYALGKKTNATTQKCTFWKGQELNNIIFFTL